ncbi:MAG: methyltransferase domain-containing protein [Pedobacter sp.]
MTVACVHIEKLAFGGNGIGRINGKVCFVPLSCPGDELLVNITAEKRSYLTAGIAGIITPSHHRVVPPCPLFNSCGGCGWQHIAYPVQVDAKRQFLVDALWRGARVPVEKVSEIVRAPEQYGYRSRVQFKLHGGADKLRIGFYRHASHVVEDATQGCPIVLPVINEALFCLRDVLSSFPESAAIPQINIDCGEQGVVAIIKYIGRDPDRVAAFFEKNHCSLEPLTGVFLQTGTQSSLRRVSGSGILAYSLPGGGVDASTCSLIFRPGGFSQVNSAQNRAMLNIIRELACLGGDERVLDLYCGNGNFSLPLAYDVATITGIEENVYSIASAVDNCQLNGIDNAEYIASDAAKGVRRLADNRRHYDVVILDPPRSGAADTVGEICRLNPDKIIYISCDPSTLARDCGLLLAGGFSVFKSIPVDMFPQTYHLESITLLQRV